MVPAHSLAGDYGPAKMDDDDHDLLFAALAAAADGDDPTDHMPMTCAECGERCADRAESWVHTRRTGHRRFQQCRSDIQDQLPCRCRDCGQNFANRSAAEVHTRQTGHRQFEVQGRHCSHCAGFSGGRCACTRGCPKPASAQCDSRASKHCNHCRGLDGMCACSHGCPRKDESECRRDASDGLHGMFGQLLRRLHEDSSGLRASDRSGHSFDGDECGVCRECGMCTFRITGPRQCMNDRQRGPTDRPRICGCGAGASVCSSCGVGPCCGRRTPCTRAHVPRPPALQRERSGRTRANNAPENALDEDMQLAEAIARSLDEGQTDQNGRQPYNREQEDLDMAIALSLAEDSQSLPTPLPAPPPRPPAQAWGQPKSTPPKSAQPSATQSRASQPKPAPPKAAQPKAARPNAVEPEHAAGPHIAAGGPRSIDYDYIARCTDNFSAEQILGAGAYGTVYHGVDIASESFVEFAAKRLECEDPQQREGLERMTEAEIRVLTAFAHPNIIALHGYCLHPDGAILVYEFLPEGSLDQHLGADEKAVRLTWGRRSSIVAGLLAAVSYLHHHDPAGPCYHRDIKPANIMLTASLSPKLGDCGLSRFLPEDRPGQSRMTMQMTAQGGFRGTPGFMCPRYVDTGSFNDKSEVYSIGVTILQILTAQQNFTATFPDGSTLSDLIDEREAETIIANCDKRLPLAGSDLDIIRKLSAMVTTAVQRFAKRTSLMPLLRQAREAAASAPLDEVMGLKSEVDRMAEELRRLRMRGAMPSEPEKPDPGQRCELCFEDTADSLACPNNHHICADCAPQMVRNFLERVGASDAMLDDHRDRGGFIPCVRHNPAFQPQCSGHYTDQALARALPDEVFVAYRAAQDDVTENRIWSEHNQRFQDEVSRLQREYERQQSARHEHVASAEFLRRQYPNAKMCPQCRCGPVINENCFDLQSHHNEVAGRSRINNSCQQCGFFTRDWNQWLPWDGVLRETNT
mmetsp:Transcript_8599/g.20423  ORF Transcript_8599/g.20423 Transcript_8599/m.20423 type:complete len:974 (-) Transcript_8599:50-2971(-)